MGVKEDLVKLKGTVQGWTATAEGYRSFVAGVLLLVGWFAVLGPLESRLDRAREARDELQQLATWVEEIRELEAQTPSFAAGMVASKSALEWNNYIAKCIEEAGAEFRSLTEGKTESIKDYTFFMRELLVSGSFEQLTELVDLLERGDRYLRIDQFTLRPSNGVLSLRATLRCFIGETTAQKRARQFGGPPTSDFGGA